MDTVYKKWGFSNLKDAIEEGGALYGKNVYLFCSTEGHYSKDQEKAILIPIVVAVVSPFPPSDKIGIASIQKAAEMVLPMKEMKMGWVPYIPCNKRHFPLEQVQTQIHIWKCTQRRAALKLLQEERIINYQYILPYFYNPLKEDETEPSTVLQVIYPSEPAIVDEFDWEFDTVEELAKELAETLADDKVEDFKDFVKQMVKEEKKRQRESMGPWFAGEVEWLTTSPPGIKSCRVQGSDTIRDEAGIVPQGNLAAWMLLSPWL